jgi:subtilase family serine protease
MEETPGGWNIAGGTSLATPTWAGIINAAGTFHSTSYYELLAIYSHMAFTADYRDITYGYCGPYAGYLAASGWDPCTGAGVPKGYGYK